MPEKATKIFDRVARILAKEDPADQLAEGDLQSPDYDDLRKVWELTGKIQASKAPEDQWRLLQDKMHADAERKPRIFALKPGTDGIQNRFAFYALRLAAAIFLSFATYWSVDYLFLTTGTVTTVNGETRVVDLPDGSIAELNAGSTLIFSKKKREVRLLGEAFFQVQVGNEKFVVESNATRVTVLGTEFNVRARGENVTVAVAHGKVSFMNHNTPGEVLLTKGRMSRVQGQSPPTSPAEIDLDRFLAWRQGRLEFVRTPLAESLSEVERHFGVIVQYENVDIEGKTLTASFGANQNALEVISAVGLTFGWQISEQDDIYELHQ